MWYLHGAKRPWLLKRFLQRHWCIAVVAGSQGSVRPGTGGLQKYRPAALAVQVMGRSSSDLFSLTRAGSSCHIRAKASRCFPCLAGGLEHFLMAVEDICSWHQASVKSLLETVRNFSLQSVQRSLSGLGLGIFID